MSQAHHFNVQYDETIDLIEWSYDGGYDSPLCAINAGDTVTFSCQFVGKSAAPAILKCLLAASPTSKAQTESPFVEGDPVNLLATPTLTVGSAQGNWAFIITFAVQSQGGPVTWRFVPDPELQVNSRPPK
ncbi:hypothetical protein [Massilia sp. NR 4-1]|uniref:hypothetical protein n=1 Tax=Massilia sp. NR 4-1 TaxID=1678028 RepID=UPI00067B94A8|nr:hypothetical protein [Massilia sp. NR 4-1]AKU23262.1 hypothetical protein ACZ75_19165 [Massilia sp. NR 4-1]